MKRCWYMLLVLALATPGCRIWTDYGDADAGLSGDACGFLCDPDHWWDTDYEYRLAVRNPEVVEGRNPVVLPIILGADDLDRAQLRDDADDLRVVVNGDEVPRELVSYQGGEMVVWARFDRAPGADDAVHLYWGHPDANVPDAPWKEHIAAFHFEGDFDTSVPEGEDFQAINEPSIFDQGRLGKAASVPSWPGSLRLYDAPVFQEGTMSFEFSFRGRVGSPDGDDSIMRVPVRDGECTAVEVAGTASGETRLTWIDPTTCTGENDQQFSTTVGVNMTDGDWHDVVVSVDHARGTASITVDEQHATTDLDGGGPLTSRVDLPGGISDAPPGEFLFDEVRISTAPRTEAEARLITRAMRGEVFELGGTQRQ